MILSDLSLARRLERAEACAGARFVEARARHDPASGAQWIEVAGAYAMFDGASSPVTQTFGLGIFDPVTHTDLEKIEAFFQERGAPVHHEVSPLAGKSLLPLLHERGYAPIELSSVMFLPVEEGRSEPPAKDLRVRLAEAGEQELWAQTAVRGWSDSVDLGGGLLELMRIGAARAAGVLFLAERNGQPIAAGSLSVEGSVALLTGASTVPQARKLGAQQALLNARLRYAAQAGCELAMVCAEPGSASQRNAERQGFRIAYTRIKWRQSIPR